MSDVIATDDESLILRNPGSPSDWDGYFDLRWRIWRAPWGKPRGSERDSSEEAAFRLLLLDSAGTAVACGRLHFNNPDEARVRYMAIHEDARGRGYGSRILQGLEADARRGGALKIVLTPGKISYPSMLAMDMRQLATPRPFLKSFQHTRMEKLLCARLSLARVGGT